MDYLQSKDAPDNVFFRLETIDQRFPSLDFGPSLLLLMKNYSFSEMTPGSGFLVLKKDPSTENRTSLQFMQSVSRELGEMINLPHTSGILFLQAKFHPTWFGKVANFVLNVPPVQMSVFLRDGSKRQYRMIPQMAESGFMVSPLIENNQDMMLLMRNRPELAGKEVISISFTVPGMGRIFWGKKYALGFSEPVL
jgi:hypothetical protein